MRIAKSANTALAVVPHQGFHSSLRQCLLQWHLQFCSSSALLFHETASLSRCDSNGFNGKEMTSSTQVQGRARSSATEQSSESGEFANLDCLDLADHTATTKSRRSSVIRLPGERRESSQPSPASVMICTLTISDFTSVTDARLGENAIAVNYRRIVIDEIVENGHFPYIGRDPQDRAMPTMELVCVTLPQPFHKSREC